MSTTRPSRPSEPPKKQRRCVEPRKSKPASPTSAPDSPILTVSYAATGPSEACVEALTFLYHRLTTEIELMIRNRFVDADARHATVRAIQAISLLNHELRDCTAMTPRVAAAVFYQLRCKRPVTVDKTLPYNDVPWALKLSPPPHSTEEPEDDSTQSGSEGCDPFQRSVAKISRAPPPNPRYYYERRLLAGEGDRAERRLRDVPLGKCERKTWEDALEVVLAQERISELETAPPEVHAFVSATRKRFDKDMRRTSKSSCRCVNRLCKRCYPCYGPKHNDFNEQILFHLFPRTDRHYTRYWLAILNSHAKPSIGPVSFCSNLCFEQVWVPRMKATLGSTQWTLNTDDTTPLEAHSTHRVHAVLHQLLDRNKRMHTQLKQLLDRDQRSATCLRERDVKSITELVMYVLNVDTVVVMLLAQLRASDLVGTDPCPYAWRAKLADADLHHYVGQASNLLEDRLCWNKDAKTTLVHTPHDIAHLQARCRTHVRKHKTLFVKLKHGRT